MKNFFGFIAGAMLILSMSANVVYALPYADTLGAPDVILDGNQYSDISALGTDIVSGGNEWYVDGTSIWTAWNNQWVEYTADLDAGNWNIGLDVINHGDLGGGSWYSSFLINNNLTNETIDIMASDTEINNGFVNLDLTAGIYTIKYSWLNDKYTPADGLDANIEIVNAFFDNTATSSVPEPATMLLFGTGLAGLAVTGLRRKKKT